MEPLEERNAAYEGLNGAEFAGRALTINEARPREERPQGGGGGGYNRGGGRDRGGRGGDRGDRGGRGGDRGGRNSY